MPRGGGKHDTAGEGHDEAIAPHRRHAAINHLITDAYETARTLLSENRSTLEAIAAALLREESLDREQLAAIVGTAALRAHGL
jgi:ATP-dependent Zn protease